MAARYELTDAQWAAVEGELPPHRLGRPRRDDRQQWNALLWILCTGAPWRDLPARYGPWQTAYERFRRWAADGTFERVLHRLRLRLDAAGLLDLDTWLVDSTTVRATKSAAGGTKKKPSASGAAAAG